MSIHCFTNLNHSPACIGPAHIASHEREATRTDNGGGLPPYYFGTKMFVTQYVIELSAFGTTQCTVLIGM